MSWQSYHNLSVENASLAELAFSSNDFEKARQLYFDAAAQELSAFNETPLDKNRTRGITLVSAVSLFFKAREFDRAEELALGYIGDPDLPAFAKGQIKDLIQTIWQEKEFAKSNVGFAEGEVLVSVSGGDVVTGGAPLELILTKVSDISRYFYRTIEMLLDKPLRIRGAPEKYIQEQCRPWLFQAPAGSYQFAVRVQRPRQTQLFGDDLPKIQHITDKFIEIIDAAAQEDIERLKEVVPNEDYRKAFLKMTRNLAPTGKSYEKLEIRTSRKGNVESVVLSPESRGEVNKLIKESTVLLAVSENAGKTVQLIGTLRALHLDKDWLEVTVTNDKGDQHIKVTEAGDAIDDVVGPMVNQRVIVEAVRTASGAHLFRDIQVDD